ncbi:MAG: ceramidase domain-containing protein [Cyclobacteriaceae bacterium]
MSEAKHFWDSLDPAHCMPNCWCEAVRYGEWIRQPMNTWSNLFLILVAIYIIRLARKDISDQNELTRNPAYSNLFAFGCILTGLGSMFFHASLTYIGNWVDIMGMYFIAIFLILYNYSRIRHLSISRMIVWYVCLISFFGILIYKKAEINNVLFGFVVLGFVISAILVQRKLKSKSKKVYLWLAIVSYYTGSTFWYLDNEGLLCRPDSWMQGHALWHILSGTAVLLIYLYFRSEEELLKKVN